MVKSIKSVILLLSILCGVQQFSPALCDDCDTFDCMINEILSFIPFMSGSGYDYYNGTGYDDYYENEDFPSAEEEIIIIPLTLSAPEILTSGSTISPSSVPSSRMSNSAYTDYDTNDTYYTSNSGEDAYDYGLYSYPISSEYGSGSGSENISVSGEGGLLDDILGLLGLSSSGSGEANATIISAPSVSSPANVSAPAIIPIPLSTPAPLPIPISLSTPAPTSTSASSSSPSSPSVSFPASSPSASSNTSAPSDNGTTSSGSDSFGSVSGSGSGSGFGLSYSGSGNGSGSGTSSSGSLSGTGSGNSSPTATSGNDTETLSTSNPFSSQGIFTPSSPPSTNITDIDQSAYLV